MPEMAVIESWSETKLLYIDDLSPITFLSHCPKIHHDMGILGSFFFLLSSSLVNRIQGTNHP